MMRMEEASEMNVSSRDRKKISGEDDEADGSCE
jgi:hypothetical protein